MVVEVMQVTSKWTAGGAEGTVQEKELGNKQM